MRCALARRPPPAGDADWIVSTSRNKTERKGEVKSTSVSNKYDLLDDVETKGKDKGKGNGTDGYAPIRTPLIESASPESVSPEPASTRLGSGSGSGFGKFCSSKLLCIFFTSVVVLSLGCSAFALSSVVNFSNPTALPVLNAATYRATPNITPKAADLSPASQARGAAALNGRSVDAPVPQPQPRLEEPAP